MTPPLPQERKKMYGVEGLGRLYSVWVKASHVLMWLVEAPRSRQNSTLAWGILERDVLLMTNSAL